MNDLMHINIYTTIVCEIYYYVYVTKKKHHTSSLISKKGLKQSIKMYSS